MLPVWKRVQRNANVTTPFENTQRRVPRTMRSVPKSIPNQVAAQTTSNGSWRRKTLSLPRMFFYMQNQATTQRTSKETFGKSWLTSEKSGLSLKNAHSYLWAEMKFCVKLTALGSCRKKSRQILGHILWQKTRHRRRRRHCYLAWVIFICQLVSFGKNQKDCQARLFCLFLESVLPDFSG